MYASQLEAYRTVEKTTMSGREVEASVLTQAAMKLKHCQDYWNSESRDQDLDEALKYNQLIWTIFQSELSNPDHPMPRKLREDILSLAAFIDKRTFDIMAYPDRDKLTVLINININIAAGLRESPG